MIGQEISHHNKKFLPAREAARIVGYTSDYISKLSREGKISAERKDRTWYVDVESLKLFSLNKEAELRERQTVLSLQRRAEFLLSQSQYQKNNLSQSTLTSSSQLALGKAAVLLLIVALLGSLSWHTYKWELDQRAFILGATSISDMMKNMFTWSWYPSDSQTNLDLIDKELRKNETHKADRVTSASTTPTGLMVFKSETHNSTTELIEESFSDPVSIEFDTERTGVIKPKFSNQSDESYRFLLVPITADE